MKNVLLFIVLGLFFVGCDMEKTLGAFNCYAPDPGIWYCVDGWDGDDTDMGNLCETGIDTPQFSYEDTCEDWHAEYLDGCDCVQYLP